MTSFYNSYSCKGSFVWRCYSYILKHRRTQFTASEVIATANDGDVSVESEGVRTFVEDQKLEYKGVKTITLEETSLNSLSSDNDITVTLKGNYVLDPDTLKDANITDKNGLFSGISMKPAKDSKDNDKNDEFIIELGERNAKDR